MRLISAFNPRTAKASRLRWTRGYCGRGTQPMPPRSSFERGEVAQPPIVTGVEPLRGLQHAVSPRPDACSLACLACQHIQGVFLDWEHRHVFPCSGARWKGKILRASFASAFTSILRYKVLPHASLLREGGGGVGGWADSSGIMFWMNVLAWDDEGCGARVKTCRCWLMTSSYSSGAWNIKVVPLL